MLVIRMQRTGRKGHAMFRVVVQDSRRTPSSGKVIASLGSYDPHSKDVSLNTERASFYLEHGAQPSDRVARLLQAEGVKLPKWVALSANKQRTVRNADKRRSTTPAPEPAPEAETPAETSEAANDTAETTETLSDETPETVAKEAADTAPSADDATVETEAEAAAATDAETDAEAEIKADEAK